MDLIHDYCIKVMNQVKPRRYDSTRRQAQAAVTQRDVVAAAGRLFEAKGYAATTVREIADEAGVSPETIYAAFRNKRTVLKRWVETTIAGDDLPIAMIQRDWADRTRAEPDARRALGIAVAAGREILQRSAAAMTVLRAAGDADPRVAQLHTDLMAQRHDDMVELTSILAGKQELAVDTSEAADIIWAVTSPEAYQLLVVDRGWTPERFGQWTADTLAQLLIE
jgi:AcrR family transcriptional regulator